MSNRAESKPRPWQHADMGKANESCNANIVTIGGSKQRASAKSAKCPVCTMSVLLHCYDCNIQVTGCLCTEYERFGQDEGWKRAVARWGEQAARQRAEIAGLWVPPVQ